ncbi:MAG: HD domain-containing protein [Acidobacteria bacterium]|nr:HD domain-containing protein [Acidobacteriota bacterium]MCZ6751949.1 HD domain-containing protein [Acidobacteriota bacterium]
MKRIRILHVILSVLVLASVGPLVFYAFQTMASNRQELETKEMELQNITTDSIANEIYIYNATFQQQFDNLLLDVHTSLFDRQEGYNSPDLREKLKRFVGPSSHIIYVTLTDAQGRGPSEGTYNADSDPFLIEVLKKAFAASEQGIHYQSDPVMITQEQSQFPSMVVSRPIMRRNRFQGMLAVVVELQFLVDRLASSSKRGLEAFVVNNTGRLVLTPNPEGSAIGRDMSDAPIIQQFLSWRGRARAAETSSFDLMIEGEPVRMVGTYSPVQSLQWAVIAQKKESDAYIAVDEMERETLKWGVAALLMSLAVGYFFTLRIVRPIRVLTESSRAISRGDFSTRVHLVSRTEIGELATTFNLMSSDLELYVEKLKAAAEENRKLFLDSIRMIAAAVDEKDPYTHGHSERVARYSVMIATNLSLPDEEIETIRVSAHLHDVGKIGIADRILNKPGVLTQEEFAIMKQHTQKGATILRRVRQLAEMIPGVELHHESLDGRGYPYGLQGDEIPRLARIIAVADTFDAMTTHRPYQSAMEPGVAVEHILSLMGKRFDPDVAMALDTIFKSGRLKMSRAATLA